MIERESPNEVCQISPCMKINWTKQFDENWVHDDDDDGADEVQMHESIDQILLNQTSNHNEQKKVSNAITVNECAKKSLILHCTNICWYNSYVISFSVFFFVVFHHQ